MNEMGPAKECGTDHKPRKEDFTQNWRHESQTSRTEDWASRCLIVLKQNPELGLKKLLGKQKSKRGKGREKERDWASEWRGDL
ncbi:hypothetical protein V6N11_048201 [Hibiscus sabdariffa]|uniref:Uncharacterized protein n=1 Tax=Hibiscus sabdariffa TaxID=183260 RepID=A0ABR2AB08_9ROSI